MDKNIKITTDHKYREIVCFQELSKTGKEQILWSEDEPSDELVYFTYKGNAYNLNEFMRFDSKGTMIKKWDGYFNHTIFSGILVKYSDCGDGVKVGYYCSTN